MKFLLQNGFCGKEAEWMESHHGLALLVGKVIRLHSKAEPDKADMYLVTTDEHSRLQQGTITPETVAMWSKCGYKITVYKEQFDNGR